MMRRISSLHDNIASLVTVLFHKPHLDPCSLYSLTASCSFSYTPDSTETLYDNLLKSCNDLSPVRQIHSSLTTKSLITRSPHLGAQLILKYSNFGTPSSARSLFDDIYSLFGEKPCSFLCNTMIRAYANGGHCVETFELYVLMHRSGVSVNNFTYPFVLRVCGSNLLVLEGRVVHCHALKNGFASDLHVEAALIDMYTKCRSLDDGRKVFDQMATMDLVSWTSMITGYEQGEKPEEALVLLREMQQKAGLSADSVTVVSVASAVAQLGDLKSALSVHSYSVRQLFINQVFVANAIIAMYAKCGDMDKARSVFEQMHERNVITWNSMLSGFTQNGQAGEALLLFDQMQDSDCDPTPVTTLIMISACAYLGSQQLGRKFHNFMIDRKMDIETNHWNALIDMYAKSGDLETAVEIFNGMPQSDRSAATWNALISGYGMHGHGKEVLELFRRMQREDVEPNHITFTSVLSACSHAGLVDEGRNYFAEMKSRYMSLVEVKHFACMVDMLGRAGHMQEAFELIKNMPLPPNDSIWGALLLACKVHGNLEIGKIAADNLFQLEPDHTGYYVLMSNIYAASNKWQEVSELRQNMNDKGLKKPAAFSVVEHGKQRLGFHTYDRENSHWPEVYKKVESLAIELKTVGHVPDLSCALHDIEDEDKEHVLNYHSEKLAVAFGLLKNDPGATVHVTKNLRICNDCHSVFKFISYMYKRKIVVRDSNRFHHFEGGSCSCRDYW